MKKYSYTPKTEWQGKFNNKHNNCAAVGAQGRDVRCSFKNTYNAAKQLKGKTIAAARSYLERVLEHKDIVPFTRFNTGIGRHAQCKKYGVPKGRWPEKSCKVLLGLLKNLEANAEAKKLDVDEIRISHVQVNQAAPGHRRTYRAHGRINKYNSQPCHIELIAETKESKVPLPTPDGKHRVIKLSKRQHDRLSITRGAIQVMGRRTHQRSA